MTKRRSMPALVAIPLVLFAVSDADAQGKGPDNAVGVQLGAYFEDGEVDDNYRISVTDQSDGYDYENEGTLNLALAYMTHISESLRAGGLLRYYGSYGVDRVVEEDEEDADAVPTFVMGTLLEAVGEVEWLVPIVGADWELAIGGQLGLPVLIPDRDLEAQIDALNDEGIEVLDSPRVGYLVGVRVGARYRLTERVGLNAAYAVQVSEIFLYDTDGEVNTIPVLRETSLGIVRQNVFLGTEVFF